MMRNRVGRGVLYACLLLGIIGALANVIAIVMQVRMGFTMPIVSMVALFVGGFTAYLHARRLFEPR